MSIWPSDSKSDAEMTGCSCGLPIGNMFSSGKKDPRAITEKGGESEEDIWDDNDDFETFRAGSEQSDQDRFDRFDELPQSSVLKELYKLQVLDRNRAKVPFKTLVQSKDHRRHVVIFIRHFFCGVSYITTMSATRTRD